MLIPIKAGHTHTETTLTGGSEKASANICENICTIKKKIHKITH